MTPLAAALLVAALAAAPARAAPAATVETAVTPEDFLLNVFLFPYAYAFSLPHRGFTRYPFETEGGYGAGPRPVAFALKAAALYNRGGRKAQTGLLRVRGDNRLGWDFAWDAFDRGSFGADRRAGYYSGHITANYLQAPAALLEFGLGAASFQAPADRWGPSAELALELFPRRPWSVSCRYEASVIARQGYHELSADAGASWRWLGLGAGYRALLNPVRDAYGPELLLRGWF